MKSVDDITQIPLLSNATRPILGDVVNITNTTTNGENDNMGTMPYLSVTANIDHTDLGTASKDAQKQ